MELIDRKAVCKDCYVAALCEAEEGHERCIIKRTLEFQPVVDAVPVVHGHWHIITGSEHLRYVYRCSECWGSVYDFTYSFCPYCGAKMDVFQPKY